MRTKAFHLGIDLGTTNTYVSYLEEGETHPSLIAFGPERGNTSESANYPSIIDFLEMQSGKSAQNNFASSLQENNKERLGDFVRNFKVQVPSNPQISQKHNVSAKAAMQKFVELLLQDILKAHFSISENSDKPGSILEKQGLQGLTITVPSAWHEESSENKEFMRQCFIECGLPDERVGIWFEPASAALYHFHQNSLAKANYAVIDIGGGTTDFAMVQLEKQNEKTSGKLLCHSGHAELGGSHFDEAIYELVTKEQSGDQNPQLELFEAQRYKTLYTDNPQILEAYGVDVEILKKAFNNPLQRYEEALRQFIKDMSEIEDSSQNDNDVGIDAVLMVGGMSLFGPIRELTESLLEEKLGKPLYHTENDSFCSIALGASIFSKEKSNFSQVVSSDIYLQVIIRSAFGIRRLTHDKEGNQLIPTGLQEDGYWVRIFKKGREIRPEGITAFLEDLIGSKIKFSPTAKKPVVQFSIAFCSGEELQNRDYKPFKLSHDLSEHSISFNPDDRYDLGFVLNENGILQIDVIKDGLRIYRGNIKLHT